MLYVFVVWGGGGVDNEYFNEFNIFYFGEKNINKYFNVKYFFCYYENDLFVIKILENIK